MFRDNFDENYNFNLLNQNGEEVNLAMQSIFLTGDIYPFGARLIVRHAFKVNSIRPIECIYSFMLPKDGTLRRFIILHNDKRIESMLKEREEAEEIYEDAIDKGHLSVLTRQYRDGIINLNVGNLKNNELVVVILEILSGISSMDETFRFRFPFTIAPSYHRGATYLETSEGTGEISLPEDIFDDIILPEFKKDASNLHKINFNLNIYFPENSKIYSPSHSINVEDRNGFYTAFLNKEADIPNRDLMINIDCKFNEPKIWYSKDSVDKYSFSCIIPGDEFKNNNEDKVPARVLFILDKSGSMYGEPLKRAEKALINCIKNLSDEDLFGLITFASEPTIITPSLLKATSKNKKDVIKLLKKDRTDGGTEILEALKAGVELLEGEGAIFLITDGQIWESESIINFDYKDVKIHCLGIGSSSQDRFMANLTYSTGGNYIFLSLNEEIEEKALKLFTSIINPIAENITVNLKGKGKLEPKPAKIVYKYLKIYGYLDEINENSELEVFYNNGKCRNFKILEYAERANGESLRQLRGSKIISLVENKAHVSEKYKNLLKKLGQEYGISNSQMSLVAVVKRKGDIEGEIPETKVVPVGMAEGTRFDAYFSNQYMMSKTKDLNVSYDYIPCKKCLSIDHDLYKEDYDTPTFLRRKSDEELLTKKIEDLILKIESYSIIDEDDTIEAKSTEEQALKLFLLFLLFKIAKLLKLKDNYSEKTKKLGQLLNKFRFFKQHPEFKKLHKDKSKLKDEKFIEKLIDLIENYVINESEDVLEKEMILLLFEDN